MWAGTAGGVLQACQRSMCCTYTWQRVQGHREGPPPTRPVNPCLTSDASVPLSNGYRPGRIAALLAAWAVALAGVVFVLLRHESDPLCSAIDEAFGMACSTSLPLASTLPPGTLVDSDGRPQGTLAGEGCLLPGAVQPALAITMRPASSASLPRQTYTVLSGAGGTAMPGPPGLFADARRWPDLQEVGVEVGRLRELTLPAPPEGLACQLRADCAARLANGDWRLVTGVLVGHVRYRAFGQDQRPLAPVATGPGHGTNLLPDEGGWALPGERTAALRFADAAAIDALAHCDQPVARHHAGTASVRIEGGGLRGALASDAMRQPLGKVALVSARGSEVSDCDPGLGRERSHAYAQALVDSMTDGGLRLGAEIRASSGRYRAGRCPTNGRRLPSNNMLVTRAAAAVDVQGELAVLVRGTGPHTLQVDWVQFPAGARLRITGPDGRWLHDAVLAEPDGSQRFEVRGPGVFRVQPTVVAQIEREGESGVKSTSFHAQVHAWAWPPGGEAEARAADGNADDAKAEDAEDNAAADEAVEDA